MLQKKLSFLTNFNIKKLVNNETIFNFAALKIIEQTIFERLKKNIWLHL